MSSIESQVDVLGQVQAQHAAVAKRLEIITHVFAVSSGKGGVGKSALTANLAAALATDGAKVGVLDADIHGPTAALMLGARGQQVRIAEGGVRPAVGVADTRVMSMDLFLSNDESAVRWKHPGGLAEDGYVWRGALEANVLREFLADTDWGPLEWLLVDMPPGADRFETLVRLVPGLAGTLMVTTPSLASQTVVKRSVTSARRSGARIFGLIVNMTRSESPADGLAESCGLELLARVPFEPQFASSTDAGRPYVLEHPEAPAALAITGLAQSLGELVV